MLTELSPGVSHLRIETEEPFPFRPGQYVPLRFSGSPQRYYYSIASAPTEDAGNSFELVVGAPKSGPPAPFSLGGEVILEPASGVDVLALAGARRSLNLVGMGTGVAPLRSLVESCVRSALDRSVSLLVGARDGASLPFHREFLDYDSRGTLRYLPVFSRARVTDGLRGRVQEHVDSLVSADAFFVLCGSTAMVTETRSRLRHLGVADDAIYGEGYGD